MVYVDGYLELGLLVDTGNSIVAKGVIPQLDFAVLLYTLNLLLSFLRFEAFKVHVLD